MAYARAIMQGARRVQSPPPVSVTPRRAAHAQHPALPPPNFSPFAPAPRRSASSPPFSAAAHPPPLTQPPPPPLAAHASRPQTSAVAIAAACCRCGCRRFREMEVDLRSLCRRSASSFTIGHIRSPPQHLTPTVASRRPASALPCPAHWEPAALTKAEERAGAGPGAGPGARSALSAPRGPAGWTRWSAERPSLPAPAAPEITDRYAQVPTVHSVIQSFSKGRAWQATSASPPHAAATASGDMPAPSTHAAQRAPALAPRGHAPGLWGPLDDADDWAPPSLLPPAAGARLPAAQWQSYDSESVVTRPPPPSPPLPAVPIAPAAHWTLGGAVRRVCAFMGGLARAPLTACALRLHRYSAAEKVPFFYGQRSPGRHRARRSHHEDAAAAAAAAADDDDRHLRAASALTGVGRNIKAMTVSRRLGAAVLSSFVSMRPPAAAASSSAADVEADMPDGPHAHDDDDDGSSAYDEGRDYDERGDGIVEVYETDSRGSAYDYVWKQDGFSALPASLLRKRPESEYPSSIRNERRQRLSLPPPAPAPLQLARPPPPPPSPLPAPARGAFPAIGRSAAHAAYSELRAAATARQERRPRSPAMPTAHAPPVPGDNPLCGRRPSASASAGALAGSARTPARTCSTEPVSPPPPPPAPRPPEQRVLPEELVAAWLRAPQQQQQQQQASQGAGELAGGVGAAAPRPPLDPDDIDVPIMELAQLLSAFPPPLPPPPPSDLPIPPARWHVSELLSASPSTESLDMKNAALFIAGGDCDPVPSPEISGIPPSRMQGTTSSWG